MENALRGIVLLISATVLFSMSDAMAKYLSASLPAVEISWIRYGVFVVFARLLAGGRRRRVRSGFTQVMRGLMLVASAVLFILALPHLPLADAASIGFASPILITVLSVFMLRETVGIRRWSAVLVGFLGVLVIIRPGTGAFQPAALLVLGSSLAWAFATVLTRRMAGADDAASTLLWSAVTGFAVLTLLLPFNFVMPSVGAFILTLVLGVIASSGQYLMVLAYRHANASLLAPFSYGQLIWSTTLGYLVFGTFPDLWTGVGAVIIVGSGLYTANRERIRARERRVAAEGQ